jgi:hypothetical protein
MFWHWKIPYGSSGFVSFMDAGDAAGTGGGANPGDEGDGSQPSEDVVADNGTDPGGAGVEDDDRDEALDRLLVDDDDEDQTRTETERFKALQKKHRKLKRQLARKAGALQRLDGVDLDALIASDRKLRDFNAMLANNPRIRALLNGEAEPTEERRTPPAAEPEEQFDDKNLPFDPDDKDNPVNAWLAKLARERFEDQKRLKQLQQRLEAADKRDAARSEGEVKRVWRSTIEGAATQIKSAAVADMFREACASAYDRVRTKYTPQQVVQHYLSKLEAEGLITHAEAKATAAAAATTPSKTPVRTDATKQRIAETNKHLPRTPTATGTPAPARSARPNLKDIAKRIQGIGRSA